MLRTSSLCRFYELFTQAVWSSPKLQTFASPQCAWLAEIVMINRLQTANNEEWILLPAQRSHCSCVMWSPHIRVPSFLRRTACSWKQSHLCSTEEALCLLTLGSLCRTILWGFLKYGNTPWKSVVQQVGFHFLMYVMLYGSDPGDTKAWNCNWVSYSTKHKAMGCLETSVCMPGFMGCFLALERRLKSYNGTLCVF